MKQKRIAANKKPLEFSYAERSFIGFLEGTGKALHSIDSYRSDLHTFKEFLKERFGKEMISLKKLRSEDLDQYQNYLKAKSLRTNTRRRKLLTVRRFFRYLTKRNRLSVNISLNLPTPYKVERVPKVMDYDFLLAAIKSLPLEVEGDALRTPILARNRVLLWVLAETGCTVSEVTKLRFDDWKLINNEAWVQIGKSSREVHVSKEIYDAVLELQRLQSEKKWLFLGFNKYGSLGSPISARGVEMLVKTYAKRLGTIEAEVELTPRLIRHTAVVAWFKQGKTQDEIQKRLGLRSEYAFRVYRPLVEQQETHKETTKPSEI